MKREEEGGVWDFLSGGYPAPFSAPSPFPCEKSTREGVDPPLPALLEEGHLPMQACKEPPPPKRCDGTSPRDGASWRMSEAWTGAGPVGGEPRVAQIIKVT